MPPHQPQPSSTLDDPSSCSTATATLATVLDASAGTATTAAGSSSLTALADPLDRCRPRSALLPDQSLLQIAEPVLLPEPRSEQLHHLQPRQFHRRGHQGEPLLVAFDVCNNRLDWQLPAQDSPQADDLLPTDLPLPAVDEGGSDLLLRLPHAAPAGRLQPLPPLGCGPGFPLVVLRGQRQGVQPSVAPQAVRKSIRAHLPQTGPAAGPRSPRRSRRRKRPSACP